MADFKQVFLTEDGHQFATKAEATNYLRRPLIHAAMNAVTKGNDELTSWLVDNQEVVEMSFETGTIKRVTKAEYAKLQKALDCVPLEKGTEFIVENKIAILESFRWPSVKRMTPEEKKSAAITTLMANCNNQDMSDWIFANQEAVMAAYASGVKKREVSPAATAGLDAYRAKVAAEKAARLAEAE